jgi:hypothetical protein
MVFGELHSERHAESDKRNERSGCPDPVEDSTEDGIGVRKIGDRFRNRFLVHLDRAHIHCVRGDRFWFSGPDGIDRGEHS